MNVKRGLTRMFAVLWILWGIGLGVYAGNETRDAWHIHEDASTPVTFGDGTKITFQGTPTPQDIDEAYEHVRGTARDSSTRYEIGKRADTITSAQRWPRTLEMLGLWLVLGGLAPGAVLVAFGWVWTGFEHRA